MVKNFLVSFIVLLGSFVWAQTTRPPARNQAPAPYIPTRPLPPKSEPYWNVFKGLPNPFATPGKVFQFETRNTSPQWQKIEREKRALPILEVRGDQVIYLSKWDSVDNTFIPTGYNIEPNTRTEFYHNGLVFKDQKTSDYYFQMVRKTKDGEFVAGWVSEKNLYSPSSSPQALNAIKNFFNMDTGGTEAKFTCPTGDCRPASTGSNLNELASLVATAALQNSQLMNGPPPPTPSTACVFPDKYKVRRTSGFGMRRHPVLGINRMHEGLDFGRDFRFPGAPEVQSVMSGLITNIGYSPSYGQYVEITNDDGTVATYNHLDRASRCMVARKGQRVAAGQQVGCMGDTGLSTATHLHLEVTRDGHPIDPEKWVDFVKLCGSRYEIK